MGMMLLITCHLMNLCIIITVAMVVPVSSGFSETLSLESSSPIPSIEAQVPIYVLKQGPLLNGLIVQPPTISPSIKSPPVHQIIQTPLPFLAPRQPTTLPPQHDLATSTPALTPHDLAPLSSAEPPKHSVFAAPKAPQDSTSPPVAELPHDSAPSLPAAEPPHFSIPPPSAEPSYNSTVTPSAEPPHASAVPPAANPPVAIPQPTLPTEKPPEALPLASPSPPPEISQHTHIIPSPHIPAAEAPIISTPTTFQSHAAPQQSVAKPPHSSVLPLAAKPPEPFPQFPVAEPPKGLTVTPSPEASPHIPLLSPPHRSTLPWTANPPESNPQFPVSEPPQAMTMTPPTELSPHSPFRLPPHGSALPLAAKPPESKPQLPVAEPPQSLTLTPPIEATPDIPLFPPARPPHPPDMLYPPLPLIAPSPPPPLGMPNASSPMPPMVPPHLSSSPPQLVPPYALSPPSQPILPNAPPPTSIAPSNSSRLLPVMEPPFPEPPISLPSPFPPLPPNILSPPPQLVLPNVSSPPPQMIPPTVLSPPPQMIPPIVSSPPPPMIPPIVSSPPPELIPPIVSAPPELIPPIVSAPPELIPPPASPPIFVAPSNVSATPPFISPPPDLPSLPPAAPSHASPPVPAHASSPLPQLVPPHNPSPPYVLSAPPPVELPHISPPRSSFVPGAVPPHASPVSPFLTPPLAPASPIISSHPLSAPPPTEPYHSPVPPSPVMQRSVPAAPPHSSRRTEPQEGASPPSLPSPEQSPSSSTLPEGAPPANQVTPRSHPPSSYQIEAPKHAPSLRSNTSEPDILPSSAPPPSGNPASGRYPSVAPPGRAPYQSPGDKLSPYHAPSEPNIQRQNATAPAPFSFRVSPASNGSHHLLHRSLGPPTPMAPKSSPAGLRKISPAPSPLPRAPPGHSGIPLLSPKISPSGSSTRKTKRPLAPPIRSLPPPPPNADCAYLTCPEPLTNTPPGSPCGCVWPMQVGMRLSVALYTFFPLVSDLAREVAAGVFMKQSQVRVMGANSAIEQPEKTIVLVDLVPLEGKFDNVTAFLTFQRFWHKQVVIDKSKFGDYDILYVRYPGLPPSPPMAPADIAVINGMPYSVGDPNKMHPLGVDVTKQSHKHRLNGIVIAAIIFSAIVGLLICCFLAWILVFRHINHDPLPAQIPQALPSLARSSGRAGNSTGSGPSSSLSVGSSLPAYTGSAKTFTANEIEKATDNFSSSRILGEGGFGLVYSGVLEDETSVAVKVLKRDDQQGGREFLAEVEMLSRLHHRNLVKLIGICTDERLRCLVYELIPNGSVDSHLHGIDKETAPLDWASRLKIALGAARGLAYLHEDSSPRVIHRDFKSSNILLENDFTPKVSDFGLARAAMDEENRHISTRVMGTFGYVAPEYAMTGHLLVKSDVYSYGVVLLELLTGRKPVDMSQPPGQENLVAWTKPFLTTKEGLELILDPSLESDVPLDNVAKVAAIASMCVQPEVSHRPFMGEVVQALKLVCNECDDSKDSNSGHGSHEDLSFDFDAKGSPLSETQDPLPTQLGQFSLQNYHPGVDVEKGMSVSEIFGASARTDRQASDSFRRQSASGPLKTVRGRQFWQRIRRQSNGGSVSEHGIMYRLWAGSH